MIDAATVLMNHDRFKDYIPFVSTYSNLHILFQKCAFKNAVEEVPLNRDRYHQYLENKSVYRCVILLIPVLGNILVALYDLATGYNPLAEIAEDPIPDDLGQLRQIDLRLASSEQRDNLEIVMPAIEENPKNLEFASDRLKNLVSATGKSPAVDLAVQKDGLLLRFAADDVRDNLHTVWTAISQNPAALEFASDRLKNQIVDDESPLVDIALTKDGLTLRFAGDDVRDNYNSVYLAVKQNPAAIEFASDRLKNEIAGEQIIFMALEKDGLLLRFTGEAVKDQDYRVLLAIAQNPAAIEFASDRLKNELIGEHAPLIDEVVKKDGLLLRFAGPAVKDNFATVLLATQQNKFAFQYASERLRNEADAHGVGPVLDAAF